jgi:hypothetical protein
MLVLLCLFRLFTSLQLERLTERLGESAGDYRFGRQFYV